jgi:hypothetical protein
MRRGLRRSLDDFARAMPRQCEQVHHEREAEQVGGLAQVPSLSARFM